VYTKETPLGGSLGGFTLVLQHARSTGTSACKEHWYFSMQGAVSNLYLLVWKQWNRNNWVKESGSVSHSAQYSRKRQQTTCKKEHIDLLPCDIIRLRLAGKN